MDYGAKRIQAGVNEVRNTPFEPCSRAQRLPATLPSAAHVSDERLPRRGSRHRAHGRGRHVYIIPLTGVGLDL
jgi:hypothetical protein